MPTPTMTEYLEADGLPLDTAAWESGQMESLADVPTTRGEPGLVVEGRPHEEPQPLIPGGKRLLVPMMVIAELDSDGDPHPNLAVGLETNLRELLTVVRPRLNRPDGTFPLRWIGSPGGTLVADATVLGPHNTRIEGAGAALLTFEFYLAGGVWRSVTAVDVTSDEVAGGTTDVLEVPHPGTADQFDVTLTLTGTATSVRITQLTWDPAGDTWIDVDVDLGGGAVEIGTRRSTAVQDGADVHGQVDADTTGPTVVWLPLLAGVTNDLEIAPTGGTCTVQAVHQPTWTV